MRDAGVWHPGQILEMAGKLSLQRHTETKAASDPQRWMQPLFILCCPWQTGFDETVPDSRVMTGHQIEEAEKSLCADGGSPRLQVMKAAEPKPAGPGSMYYIQIMLTGCHVDRMSC